MSRQQMLESTGSPIFKVKATELSELFERKTSDQDRLQTLRQHGSTPGVLQKLTSTEDSGIMGDPADIRRRQILYAKNEKPSPVRPAFWDSVKDCFNDRILFVVAAFAVLSIIPTMIVEPKTGWVNGLFILIALFVQILITAYNDHNKDTKFVRLQSKNNKEMVTTIRGKHGMKQTLKCWDLLVGDVIQLSPGDKVPADCLVISSANLKVTEPTKTFNEETEIDEISWEELYKKEDYGTQEGQPLQMIYPFLISNSYILNGTCKALVCAVGIHSTRGVKDIIVDTRSPIESALGDKLENIGGSLKFFGLIASIAILVTSIIVLFLQLSIDDEVGGPIFMKKLVENIVISLIMLVVVIPEGLPMTVAISLAHSVLQMNKYDNILVRDLASVEKVGLITDLCLGKTGTMTTEKMEVVNFYTQSIYVQNSRLNTLFNCDLDPAMIERIVESVVWNSQAHIEMTKNSFYEPVGQGTEVSLIRWLQKAEIAVHDKMAMKDGRVLAHVPFDSNLKRSIIAVHHPEMDNTVRIYVKGAPEVVIEKCNGHFQSIQGGYDENLQKEFYIAQKEPLPDHMKNEILQNQFLTKMGEKSLRAIAFSYSDMSVDDWNHLMKQIQGDFDTEEEIAYLEQNQTFVGLVGLKDPTRANMKEVVQNVTDMGIQLRLISGDALKTAIYQANDVGIISERELLDYKRGVYQGVAMDAENFRNLVGDVIHTQNFDEEEKTQTDEYALSTAGQQAFEGIIGDLKVIGRANPEDKLRLVAGLRGMRDTPEDAEDGSEGVPSRVVAVVGEGLNDIKAFKAANVSFCVADGASYARNNASMVLKTNDFDSCMRAVMWGRNIFMNVQRFLQFQITCSLACMFVVIFSYATKTESCLNAIQLIYINLIMDIFGALALAATRPSTDIAHEHFSPQAKIMTPQMYRQIILTFMYMAGIMVVAIHAGKKIFNVDYAASTQLIDTDDAMAKDKMQHFTLIFNLFVFLQVFNMINCRDVGKTKMHGFSSLHRNKLTWLILLLIIGVQVVACFTFLGRPVFTTNTQDFREFNITVVMAASVIVAGAIFKLIPNSWIDKRMPSLDETKSIGSNNRLMAAYDKQANAGVNFKKAKTEEQEAEMVTDQDQEYDQVDDSYQRN